MFNNNRTILTGMLFGVLFASVISIFMFRRRREIPVLEMPMLGLRKGRRVLQTGTRSAMRGAKNGLRVLAR